ncbi:MAG: hypothetical protein AAGD32_09265 [Planctomycetota bacterium]
MELIAAQAFEEATGREENNMYDETSNSTRTYAKSTAWVWLSAPAVAVVAGLGIASFGTTDIDRPADSAFLEAVNGDTSFDPYALERVAIDVTAEDKVGFGGGSATSGGDAAGLFAPVGGGGIFLPPFSERFPRPRSPFAPPLPGTGPFG